LRRSHSFITIQQTVTHFFHFAFAFLIKNIIMVSSLCGASKAAAAVILGAAGLAQGLSTEKWQAQSIYQVLTDRFALPDGDSNAACHDLGTFCGGTWTGIKNQLDYIQNMGFTAVWISPIVKNIQGGTSLGDAYHGFWAQDIYSLNEHFGTEDDLLDLSEEIHKRGMYLMIDVVTNHMAFPADMSSCDYTQATPFNSASYYHDPCVINDDDPETVIKCWEGTSGVSLADLRTEDANVRDIWNSWIADLVTKYKIDGLRLDTTKHVEKDFWEEFLASAGVFGTGEILNGDPKTFPAWVSDVPGFVNYPA
jgi:alpha-amylase